MDAGHSVVAPLRKAIDIEGVDVRETDVADPDALAGDIGDEDRFDVAISCLASRSG